MAADLPVGRIASSLWLLFAYAAPSVLAWALVGLLANLLPVDHAALVVVVVYGAYYGLVEISGRPGLPAPGRAWQVPSQWVNNTPRWRRALIWGSLLGPGFATRNPYAGFGLLPLVVAAIGDLRLGVALAVLLGLLHSWGRAAALLRDLRRSGADYLDGVVRQIRWRTIDGTVMLAVCGIAAATLALR